MTNKTRIEVWPATPRTIRRFLNAARVFYRDYPHWVQPLTADTLSTLLPSKNSQLHDEQVIFLVAMQGSSIVGTLMGYSRFIKEVQRKKAYWCHFECTNDHSVATLLFDSLKQWAIHHQLYSLYGPEEPRFDEFSRGLLVHGFEDDPAVFNPYHPPYYESLITQYGFTKHKDFYAYQLTFDTFNAQRVERVMNEIRARYGVTIEIFDLKQARREARDMVTIVQRATPADWDLHIPTEEEILSVINTMRLFYLPGLCFMARTTAGQPIGVVLGIPDIYQVLKPCRGNLIPYGLIRLLTKKHAITRGRVFMQYVDPDYQGKGINALIFYEMWKYLRDTKSSMRVIDGSTIGEENAKSFLSVTHSGGVLSKIYREYELLIDIQ